LVDRKSQNLAAGTLYFYRMKLQLFTRYCESQVITQIGQITPVLIRQWLLHLEETGHNVGGIHAAYRALRTFLYWWENELEPEGWKNPIRKVKAPRLTDDPLEPVQIDHVQKLIDACTGPNGARDKALLLFLLDTGARAAECLSCDIPDVNLITGEVLIRQGKGRKARSVYLEKKSRKALRVYLKTHPVDNPFLWLTDDQDSRLSYWGLREVIRRRAEKAGVEVPGLHDFRRAFAINMLRNGVDLITLSRLMGHSGLAVLKRYLKQANIDLQAAHAKGSPVEHSGLKG